MTNNPYPNIPANFRTSGQTQTIFSYLLRPLGRQQDSLPTHHSDPKNLCTRLPLLSDLCSNQSDRFTPAFDPVISERLKTAKRRKVWF